MKDYPLVTVGVLCYNTGKFVVESLDCIKKQHYPNLEIIIIDDCSTDGFSADLVQKYIDEQQLNCNYIRRKENKGISKNLNEIVAISSLNSKYLVLLGDDLWDDNFLHTSVEILEKSKENEILLYSSSRQMDYDSKEIINIIGPFYTCNTTTTNFKNLFNEPDHLLYRLQNKHLLECLFETNMMCAIGVVIKLAPFKKSGGFCDNYIIEDYPTWFKLAREGFDFLFYNKTLTTYVMHGSNMSLTKREQIRQINLQLKIDNIKYCSRIETLNQFVPIAVYSVDEKRFSLKKIFFALKLASKNYRVILSLLSYFFKKLLGRIK